MWDPMINKIRNHLSTWQSRNVASVNHVVLLCLILSTLLGSEDKSTDNWVKWERVCCERKNGGLTWFH